MGKRKDLSEFDKDQIVMARRLGQSISKTAALVGCSRSAVRFQVLYQNADSLLAKADHVGSMRHACDDDAGADQ
ncbi:hypothetical protein DPX16_2718 [Anabarilius grahami]|uniref:Uncharacterized protein n=1 Tax=Anabarilius grahami TaxID=495550 RepID=A0A3N0XGP5_ANAGA|nr:hypothetical protein DPX16_2718 [Anabarilius grahami]